MFYLSQRTRTYLMKRRTSDEFALLVKILLPEHLISSRGCEVLDFQEFQKRKDDFEVKADKYCLGEVDLPPLTCSICMTLGQLLQLKYPRQPFYLPYFFWALKFSAIDSKWQNTAKTVDQHRFVTL